MRHANDQSFLVALRTLQRQHDHSLLLYECDASLCEHVATFLADGLAAGQRGVAIVTAIHQAGIKGCLAGRHVDVSAAELAGTLLFLDARQVLPRLMRDGLPDRALLLNVLDSLASPEQFQSTRRTRIFGGIADVLCRKGRVDHALLLEEFCNDALEGGEITLLCGYARSTVSRNAGLLPMILHQHDEAMFTGRTDTRAR